MRKIAVITSSTGDCAERLVSLFNDGNRMRVELIVSDRFDTDVAGRFRDSGVEVVVSPRNVMESDPGELVDLLEERKIDLLALDGFDGFLPDPVGLAYSGRIVELTTPEEAPREIVAAFARIDGTAVPPTVADAPRHPEEATARKSVDEEWADRLHLNYDESRLRTTPPPVPGMQQAPPSPRSGFMPHAPQPMSMQGSPRVMMGQGRGEEEVMPPTYLVWSILMAVFCCTIPGIVAIVFSSQVSSRFAVGNVEGARRASRNAEIWIITSFVLGIISAVFYLPIMMLA